MKLYYSEDLSLNRRRHNKVTVNNCLKINGATSANTSELPYPNSVRLRQILRALPLPFRYVLWVISLMRGVHLHIILQIVEHHPPSAERFLLCIALTIIS